MFVVLVVGMNVGSHAIVTETKTDHAPAPCTTPVPHQLSIPTLSNLCFCSSIIIWSHPFAILQDFIHISGLQYID